MTPLQPKPRKTSRSIAILLVVLLVALSVFFMRGAILNYYGHRAFLEIRGHQLDAAIRDCRIALRFDPGSAMNHNNLGFSLYENGQFSQAEQECREALRIRPHYASAHDSLAQVLSHTGRLDEAVQECQEAIRLRPNHAVFYNSLGYALYQRGQKAEARKQWQHASTMGNPEAADEARTMLTEHTH